MGGWGVERKEWGRFFGKQMEGWRWGWGFPENEIVEEGGWWQGTKGGEATKVDGLEFKDLVERLFVS